MRYFFLSLLVYTTIALAIEAAFTSIGFQVLAACRRQKIDWNLPSKTSIWGLPVYGLSTVVGFWIINEFTPGFFDLAWPIRGSIYVIVIYAWELSWGLFIENLTGQCPWEYFRSSLRIFRYINPFYVPLWFIFGFLIERIQLQLIPHLALLFFG
ncbi:MAG: hypothetical protein WCT10_03790 [Patescibacteria group bacterium]|jgi:hypothetical protein